MARVARLERESSVLETGVLPLNYTPVLGQRFELLSSRFTVAPLIAIEHTQHIGSPYWFRSNLSRFKGGVGPRPRGYLEHRGGFDPPFPT